MKKGEHGKLQRIASAWETHRSEVMARAPSSVDHGQMVTKGTHHPCVRQVLHPLATPSRSLRGYERRCGRRGTSSVEVTDVEYGSRPGVA